MNQFGKILKFELKYYLKNKVFVGMTVFLVLLIAAVMFFPRIAALFRSDSETNVTTEREVMLVKATDSAQAAVVEQTFAAAFTEYTVKVTTDDLDTI